MNIIDDNWLQSTCQVIENYKQLIHNWDSYGGKPASQIAVDFAITFLSKFSQQPIAFLPNVSPISTGVFIEWRFGNIFAYLEIDDASVLFSANNGIIDLYYEDIDFNVDFALSIIQKFFETNTKLTKLN